MYLFYSRVGLQEPIRRVLRSRGLGASRSSSSTVTADRFGWALIGSRLTRAAANMVPIRSRTFFRVQNAADLAGRHFPAGCSPSSTSFERSGCGSFFVGSAVRKPCRGQNVSPACANRISPKRSLPWQRSSGESRSALLTVVENAAPAARTPLRGKMSPRLSYFQR